jgi:hypothetical protein
MDPTPSLPPKPSYRERFNKLLTQWGSLVLWVYFGIFGLVYVGFALAIKFGFRVEATVGEAGTSNTGIDGAFFAWLFAAWVATKLTQPMRIAATLVLTPALAAVLKRFRKPAAPELLDKPGFDAPTDKQALDQPAPDSR